MKPDEEEALVQAIVEFFRRELQSLSRHPFLLNPTAGFGDLSLSTFLTPQSKAEIEELERIRGLESEK